MAFSAGSIKLAMEAIVRKLNFVSSSHSWGKERSVFIGFLIGLISLFPVAASMILANSMTLLSELLKNVGLVLAVFLSWLSIRRIARGTTFGYNYGYGKLENLLPSA